MLEVIVRRIPHHTRAKGAVVSSVLRRNTRSMDSRLEPIINQLISPSEINESTSDIARLSAYLVEP